MIAELTPIDTATYTLDDMLERRGREHPLDTLVIGEAFNFGARSDEMRRRMIERLEGVGGEIGDTMHLRHLLFIGAFWGDPRLARAGIDMNALGMEAINLCWPGPVGHWDARHAALVAAAVREHLWRRFRRVVLCGRRVSQAFGYGHLPIPSRWLVDDVMMLVCPHPSGQNRAWNDAAIYDQVRELYEWNF